MKLLSLSFVIFLFSFGVSANSDKCTFELTDQNGELQDIFSSDKCKTAEDECSDMAAKTSNWKDPLHCLDTTDDQAYDKELEAVYCRVRLTTRFGYRAIRRYRAWGFRACRRALRQCRYDIRRYRQFHPRFHRCVIERRRPWKMEATQEL